MNIIQRIFGGAPVQAKSEDMTGSRGWDYLSGFDMMGGNSKWASGDDIWTDDIGTAWSRIPAAACEAAYAHPVIMACVNAIATRAVEPRIEIGMEAGGDGGWEAVNNHPVLDLLNNPAPQARISRGLFIQSMVSRRLLTGSGYALKVRSKAGRIVALVPIPTSWVTPTYSKIGMSLFDGFKISGMQTDMLPKDVMLCRQFDPSHPARSLGCVESAWRSFVLDREREQYQGEMLKNLKVPGMVITTETPLNPKQKEEVRKDFKSKFGRGHRGDPAFVSGKGEIKPINPLMDMDWPGLTGLSEARMCGAFGVPPIVANTRAGLDRATYSNYESALKAMYQGTMAPLWESLADDMTLDLLAYEGEQRLRIRFRYDELPQFQEDLNSKATRVVSLYNASIISRPTAQEQMGFNPEDEQAKLDAEDTVKAERTAAAMLAAQKQAQEAALNAA